MYYTIGHKKTEKFDFNFVWKAYFEILEYNLGNILYYLYWFPNLKNGIEMDHDLLSFHKMLFKEKQVRLIKS